MNKSITVGFASVLAGLLIFGLPGSVFAASGVQVGNNRTSVRRVVTTARNGSVVANRQATRQGTRQVNRVRGHNNVVNNYSSSTVVNNQQTINNYTTSQADPSPVYIYGVSGATNNSTAGNGGGSTIVFANTSINSNRYNAPPSFLQSPIRNASVGLEYRYAAAAYDPDIDSLTFGLIDGPAGMRVNAATALVTWTPTTSQSNLSHSVTVSVTDGVNQPVYQSWQIFVAGAAPAIVASNSGTTIIRPTTSAAPAATASRSRLAISNVFISSTRNINNNNTNQNQNCDVVISWTTNVPASGQVVYGTQSQPSATNFDYEFAAPETGALRAEHNVKIGCLANSTYYFRVVAFSNTERAVSAEQTLFPFRLVAADATPDQESTDGTASVLESLGNFLTNPFVLILIVAVVAYVIVRQVRKGGGGGSSVATSIEEPIINIPHH